MLLIMNWNLIQILFDHDHVEYPQPIGTFDINKGGNSHVTYDYGIKYLWYSINYSSMIKKNT